MHLLFDEYYDAYSTKWFLFWGLHLKVARSYSIDENYIKSFRGSYFISVGGAVYEMSNYIPSFGEMSYNSSGFQATSLPGYVLKRNI